MARSERTFAARPENVAPARRAVLEAALRAGVPTDSLHDVRLAVSEAVSNAIVHGYRGDSAGRITVVTETDDSRLRVVVRDDGCGMSPHVGSAGAGLGLPLVAELTETLTVGPTRPGGGTEVCMTFRLPAAVTA